DDDGGPGYSDTETKTGEDRWQSTWQNDSQEQLHAGRAEHQGRPHQVFADVTGALRAVDDDRIKGPERDQRDRSHVLDAEERYRERQPSRDWHGPKPL